MSRAEAKQNWEIATHLGGGKLIASSPATLSAFISVLSPQPRSSIKTSGHPCVAACTCYIHCYVLLPKTC